MQPATRTSILRDGERMHTTITQFVKFTVVGAAGTAGHYATLLPLVEVAGVGPVAATCVGSVCGAFINYILNYRYTFASRQCHRQTAMRFLVVALVGGVLNLVFVWLGVEYAGYNYLIVQLVATGTVLLSNFLLNKHWTFRVSAAVSASSR